MANFTEQAIKQTFLRLLNVRPLSRITVKDIAAECGINRNSFYYHYSDIPELLEEILTEEAERIMIENTDNSSLYGNVIMAVGFAIENKKAIYHIYNSANRDMFERYLQRICEKAVSDYLSHTNRDKNISQIDKEVIILYYKCLIIGFVIDWLASGMKYDLQKSLRRICDLFDGAMNNALTICENDFLNNNAE